jgi:hypothetical protein
MSAKFDFNRFLPQIAARRREAVALRRLGSETSDIVEKSRLSRHAEALDREADAIEVRLAILKAAVEASGPGHDIAALKAQPNSDIDR